MTQLSPMRSTVFSAEDVSFKYEDGTPALECIHLHIEAGEKVALLGSNGCGKSTLLKILDGLYFASAGKVEAFGKRLSETAFQNEVFNSDFRKRVGFVFQDSDAQLFMPSVLDELAFAPLQMNISRDEVKQRVDKALAALHIEALRNRAPHQLSGGEKKKVALASLLTLEPDVWLFDEPSASLDPRTVAWLTGFINDQGRLGRTVLLATHDLGITRAVADRVYLMNEAHQIIADGTPQQILENRELLFSTNLI